MKRIQVLTSIVLLLGLVIFFFVPVSSTYVIEPCPSICMENATFHAYVSISLKALGFGVMTVPNCQPSLFLWHRTLTVTCEPSLPVNSSTSTSYYSTYCVQTISGKLIVNIVQDGTGDPVAGAEIYGTETSGCRTFSPVVTSTNGSVWFGGDAGNYSMIANYAGRNYSFVANIYPNAETTISLFVPSGNFNASTYSFGSPPTRTVTVSMTCFNPTITNGNVTTTEPEVCEHE